MAYNKETTKAIIDQYLEAGFSREFAAGQAANAQIESGGRTDAFNKAEGAIGLFQHRHDRADGLRAYANKLGTERTDLSTNIGFSIEEYRGAERVAYDKIMGGDPQSAADYARLIDQHYERSDGSAREKRAALATQMYNDYFNESEAYKAVHSGEGRPKLSYGGPEFNKTSAQVMAEEQQKAMENNGRDYAVGTAVTEPYVHSGRSMGTQVDPNMAAIEAYLRSVNEPDEAPEASSVGPTISEQYLNTLGVSVGDISKDAPLGAPRSVPQLPTTTTPDGLPVVPLTGDRASPSSAGLSFRLQGSNAIVGLSMGEAADGSVGDAGFSTGEELGGAPAQTSTSGGTTSGGTASSGGTKTKAAPTVTISKDDTDEQKVSKVETLLDKVYGTKDLSDEDRKDRQRAIGLALGQGFQMLSRGTPMDVQPIIQQRLDRVDKRKKALMDKESAQGISDMLIASGYANRAQLPFMGDEGRAAAMQLLTKTPSGSGDTFSIPPAMRATMAQKLLDQGRPDLAEAMITTDGKALEKVWSEAMKGDDDSVEDYTPAERDQLAAYVEARGDPTTANLIRSGAIKNDELSKIVTEHAKVAPAVKTAGESTAAERGVEGMIDKAQAANVADALEAQGFPEEAALVRATGDTEKGLKVLDSVHARQQLAVDAENIRKRGEAVANLIPDSVPNAEALREAARNSLSSADLASVYEKMNIKELDQKRLFDIAKEDPEFMKFLMPSSVEDTLPDAILKTNVLAAAQHHSENKLERADLMQKMEMVNRMAANPNIKTGTAQNVFLAPLQQILTSVGITGVEAMSDENLVAFKLIEAFKNGSFSSMRAEGSGQTSDMESRKFLQALPGFGDTRQQILALTQAYQKMAEIKDVEYNARMDYLRNNPKGTSGYTEEKMDAYIRSKTKDMTIFEKFKDNEEEAKAGIAEGLKNGTLRRGSIVELVGDDGATRYITVGMKR